MVTYVSIVPHLHPQNCIYIEGENVVSKIAESVYAFCQNLEKVFPSHVHLLSVEVLSG